MAKIIVIGLGPAGPELVTVEALAAISATPTRFARTARHPAVSVLGDEAGSFDALYERHDTFAAVYDAIVEELLSVAEQGDGAVLYAVPGSPAVAERTVELLRERAPERGVALEIQTALSFLDLAWNRLGIDPLAAGVRMIDGHRFASQAAGDRGPLLVTQCHSREVLSDIKLALDGPGPDVIVLQRLGLGAGAEQPRNFDPSRRFMP